MIFKCKMCGGDLDINQEMRICECQYCGSRQTLPKLENDKRNNMYDRAGHFRRNNEYDKAMSLYEQILSEEAEDAEVYWSLVLCRYGIEYVEDPVSHKRMPTVNRAQFQSVLADEDYKSALKYADEQQRAIYEEEAKEIDRIQKGILAISSKEEPFDVFICYKESDVSGKRTPDSVLANDLYHQLTQEGFKVFFARITLEDKLGSAYEPYIFAALNSAKVMIVLGTKPEYFNAVWVKNEWSRYLSMIKNGESKVLIPAYKDMDPYDLPEAFSHLQAQDMSKLGFMQDLIRGIKKLTNKEQKAEQKQTETVSAGNAVQALVERAFLFLEDGDFSRADEMCEQALNQDPKNAKAYVGKLMAERRVTKQEELSGGTEVLTENNYFQKALRFAEDGLKTELERCNQMIMDRNKDRDYESALELVRQSGVSGGAEVAISMLTQAIYKYENLLGWKDSEAKLNESKEQRGRIIAEIYEKSHTLQEESGGKKLAPEEAIQKLETAIEGYKSIAGFQNVDDVLKVCRTNLDRLYKAKKNRQMRKGMKVFAFFVIVVAVIIVVGSMKLKKQRYEATYAKVVAAIERGDYNAAVSTAEGELSWQEIESLLYDGAIQLMEDGKYEEAEGLFSSISDYKDSAEQRQEAIYQIAIQLIEDGKYEEAERLFSSISEYKDSAEQRQEATYQIAIQLIENGKYEEAESQFDSISEYKDSVEQKREATYQRAVTLFEDGYYDDAKKIFATISGYRDSTAYVEIFDWAELEEISTGKFKIQSVNKDKLPEQVVIPGFVTSIGKSAFAYCENLTDVTILDGVTYIGDSAFYFCESLTGVSIGDSVTEIGKLAFYACGSLTDVSIGDSVEKIGDSAFHFCESLTNVTIPNSVTYIGEEAFYYCTRLTNVTIPNSVTYIGTHAFGYCIRLTNVTIPRDAELGKNVFYGTPLEGRY